MSRFCNTLLGATLLAAFTVVLAADHYEGIGRPATPAEVRAWDIDVRPDFVGLPEGSGSVDEGMEIWEAQCATCHGVFGEANEVFAPLVGGTTAEDIRSGRVRALADRSHPQRTTMMKVPTVATLFDYIRRAMPWNAPKSLSDDDVYAVLAYMLYLAEVVPEDFALSHLTIRQVQERLPNRHGMTTDHAMWPGTQASAGGIGNGGKPDVANAACMRECKTEVTIASALPDYARNAHGNLADQHRSVGPVRGVQTAAIADSPAPTRQADEATRTLALANAKGCMACHGVASKVVGPGFNEVSARYQGRGDVEQYLTARIRNGGQGSWGAVPMPAQGHVSDEEASVLVQWIMSDAVAQ